MHFWCVCVCVCVCVRTRVCVLYTNHCASPHMHAGCTGASESSETNKAERRMGD